ncbi:hypothetical protein GVN20_07270 [Runella sp. CRIBMP]|uniref:hypothetical protein n=1 Tax=Runella sp. CRIBMP TaxID=2683261 RepID=UPI001411F427|nr:hypothetical protein [Runella sp. CRIBMP]NBB19150.1 hypothetical protein [Runella sp. CRIBMP]
MPKLTIQKSLFSKDEEVRLLTTLTEFELHTPHIDAPSNEVLPKSYIKSVETCQTRIGETLNQTGQGALVPFALKYHTLLEPLNFRKNNLLGLQPIHLENVCLN